MRQKKDSKCLNCNIDRTIYEQLERYCEKVGQTKTTAIERILESFLNDFFKNEEES